MIRPASIPEALPKAMEVEADAVEPVPDIPEVIEEEDAIAVKPDAIAKPLELIPDVNTGLTHKELSEKLSISDSTIRGWAQKRQTPKTYKGNPVESYAYNPDQKRWHPI